MSRLGERKFFCLRGMNLNRRVLSLEGAITIIMSIYFRIYLAFSGYFFPDTGEISKNFTSCYSLDINQSIPEPKIRGFHSSYCIISGVLLTGR